MMEIDKITKELLEEKIKRNEETIKKIDKTIGVFKKVKEILNSEKKKTKKFTQKEIKKLQEAYDSIEKNKTKNSPIFYYERYTRNCLFGFKTERNEEYKCNSENINEINFNDTVENLIKYIKLKNRQLIIMRSIKVENNLKYKKLIENFEEFKSEAEKIEKEYRQIEKTVTDIIEDY